MSKNEFAEGRIVTIRVRLTEVGDDQVVVEPVEAALGQSMAVAPSDIVDFGTLKAANAA